MVLPSDKDILKKKYEFYKKQKINSAESSIIDEIYKYYEREKHIYDWYAIVGVVALMPPVAAGLATFIAPKLFTRQEKEAASSAIVVGATVATEPAIPYALAAPLPMITANTLAGGITGVLVIAFGIKRLAPGLGIFDPLIGLMSPVGSFYLVLAIGLALNISFIIVLKGLWLRRKAKAAQQELVHEH